MAFARAAIPSITTLALAPTAVKLPPKSAPAEGPPQRLAMGRIGDVRVRSATAGLIVAT